jgi:choice-of-anchor B domain-containing protein
MRFFINLIVLLCLGASALAQSNSNFTQIGHRAYVSDISDVWGYVDPQGKEWALVGVNSFAGSGGLSIVDLSDPTTPVQTAFIPGARSIWRDIKTWGDRAYVVHDGYTPSDSADGIMIVHLDSLNFTANPTVTRFYGPFMTDTLSRSLTTAHNLYIDENGVLYVFGADVLNGGALMFDIATDPDNPAYLGAFNDYYLHDGMVRGDTLWGGAVYNGILSAINVSVKSNPQVMGTQTTPGLFTHNCWISDDGQTLFTTDEKSGATVASYDVSDLSNITLLDQYVSSPGMGVIPHNAHVLGDYLLVSYYTDGLIMLDATYPEILIQAGNFDSSPNFTGNGYNGNWGVYPNLPSGLILATDIQNGLYVLQPNYQKGCYLFGHVKDSITGNPISGADFSMPQPLLFETSNANGDVAIGTMNAGSYLANVSAPGYQSEILQIALNNGVRTDVEIALLPIGFSVKEFNDVNKLKLFPNPSNGRVTISNASLSEAVNNSILIFDQAGRQVFQEIISSAFGKIEFDVQLPNGFYQIQLINNQGKTYRGKLVIENK